MKIIKINYIPLKITTILFVILTFTSCDLSFLVPDEEPPRIAWQEYKINEGLFIDFPENLYLDPVYEIIEIKVKVTDDGSDISKVQLYNKEYDIIIDSKTTSFSSDVFLLRWNSTSQFNSNDTSFTFDDSTEYTFQIKATDSNGNEKVSSDLVMFLSQTNGYPVTLEILSIINNDNENCIYWNTDDLIDLVPDFKQYIVYEQNEYNDLDIIGIIDDVTTSYHCEETSINIEKYFNVAIIDTFNFSSNMGQNLSNYNEYHPIPINFESIHYVDDFLYFEWELSPDNDFNKYEIWYSCENCKYSNIPLKTIEDKNITNFEINLFQNQTQFESIYPSKKNNFFIITYDELNNLTIGKTYTTEADSPPNSVNMKSVDYSIEGIDFEWYLNEKDSADFKSYNIYFSMSETDEKLNIINVNSISTSMITIDSGYVSEDGSFSFKNNFNPFNENWFWIGVEDIYGNVSMGSGISNLIDTPPPITPINEFSISKGIENGEEILDTIVVRWESLENKISDYAFYTIYSSMVPDSIQDTLGTVSNITQNSFQFLYDWDSIINCNSSGELYFWGKITDAWGQETLSQSVLFKEEPPQKPYITSIYYESIENRYVIEWRKSEDLDFESYTVYYKHLDNFSHNDIFDENCFEESFNDVSCPVGEICHFKIYNREDSEFIYDLTGDERTMYFLIVTDDLWGKKSFSTQESDCNQNENCGNGEKATPFNKIVFQSNNRETGSKIYSIELDPDLENFPIISNTDLISDSFNPIYEPWGARVVFYGWENGNYEIFSIGSGGNNTPVNLSRHPGNDFNPKYCADGSKIVFESWRDGNCELYIMDRDGLNTTRLTYNNGTDEDFNIATATLGMDKIIYVSTISGNQEVYSINEDGSQVENLTSHPANQYDPDISLDGSQIAYIGDNNGNIDIYWENMLTGDSLNITNNISRERNPRFVMNGFNPFGNDGQYLIYESDKDGTWSIYFQKLPSFNDNIEGFFEANTPINFLNKNNSNQSNPNFANIILSDVEGIYMVFESDEGLSNSIYIVDNFGISPISNPSGLVSDHEGDDYFPQIQP